MSKRWIGIEQLFDGANFHNEAAICLEGESIAAIVPLRDAPVATPRLQGLLAPGLVDCQVNGGGGALLNETPEALDVVCRTHARLGTTALMATLISDSSPRLYAAAHSIRRFYGTALPGLLGLHLEGPWLSTGKRGVHGAEHLRMFDEPDFALLELMAPMPVMVTVAPECVPPDDIARLAALGVRVSIGHTAADANVVSAALMAGATGFTHLFNAMPPLTARDPGPIGVALTEDTAWCGIILDGHHVSSTSALLALRSKPKGKLMLVSDAMPTVGSDLTAFDLDGQLIQRHGDRLETADGGFAGAHISLIDGVRYAVAQLGVPLGEALRMASLYPARFLGLGSQIGMLAAGYRADMLLLDPELNVQRVWIGGDEVL